MSEEELLTAAVKAQDEEAVAAEADSEASLAASSGDAAPELVDGEAQASAQDDAGTGDEDVTGDTAPSLDTADVNFNAPFLSKRFDRARDLVTAGLDEFARRELMEIERHTRNSNDRRTLMQEYQLVQNFYRASYIGETEFGVQRIRGGIQGARQLWEYTYPRAYDQAVTTNAKNFSVPEELIWGIMRAESHYRRDAQSPVGALGLMQLMPFTAQNVAGLLGQKEFDPHQLLDPESNIHYGTRYLQRLLERLGGSLPLVAAGYNAGPHRVASWVRGFGVLDMDEFIEHIPFVETRNYVKRVVRNVQIYSLLYSGQGRNLKWLVKPVGVTLDEKTALNENW